MKTLLLLMTFILSLVAQESIHFNKGWQLSGVATELNVSDVFNNDNIELIWAFNASTQKWEGYSQNSSTQAKINKHNFATLKAISPSQGFWIKSKESWYLTLDATASLNNSNNQIQLMNGWNLISLGEKASISPTLFGDDIIWKYSDSWKFFSKSNDLDFPTISALSMGEGFWVKTDNPREIDLDKSLAELHTFNTLDEVKAYIRDMKDQNDHFFYAYGMPVYAVNDVMEVANTATLDDGSSSQKSSATDATKTNLQEAGVDESDILKHDDEHLFFYNEKSNQILITSYTNLVADTNSTFSPITLEKHTYLKAMYLQNTHLIIVTQNNYYNNYDYEVVDGVKYDPASVTPSFTPSFNVINYDVSDINNIKKIKSVTLDGYFIESRITNKKLYLISQFNPQIRYEYAKKYVECSEDKNYYNEGMVSSSTSIAAEPVIVKDVSSEKGSRETNSYTIMLDSNISLPCYYYGKDDNGKYFMYDYSKATIISENLLPKVDHNSELIAPSKFYAPYKLSQTPTITSVTTFDTTTNELNDTISYVGNVNTTYMSPSSLYISSAEYPIYYSYDNYVEQETIYHFSLEPLQFLSKGSVRGHFLSSYSLSEYNDTLRVATTEGGWWRGNTKNSLFTFKDENTTLKQIGELTGLGEEAERIKAVRFYGDKGFIVTFRQSDPLYTIDLSVAEHPKKVGKLHVNGYSEYLHLVDANTLLSFGRDADSSGTLLGLQIQLFDISDFANPSLLDKISVGDRYTYSELSYNPSMFIYRDSDKKFAIPYRRSNYYYDSNRENYMGVFNVNSSQINEYFTLQLDSSYYSSLRGIIYDYNNSSYATMFATDKTVTKKIGD